MENDQEIDDLKTLYTEMAQNGRRLAQDIRKSIDFYLILGAILVLLSFFSISLVAWFAINTWQGLFFAGGWVAMLLFVIISAAFLGFGMWSLKLYFGWSSRYKNLLEMERKWSKTDG